MKYKHSREKINSFLENLLTHHINLKDNNWVKYSERLFDIRRDLLAKKEHKKECKHNWKLTPDTWGETCFYCGKQRKIKTTTSPEKECIHEGDKTDWHPQFCRKCGAEFMYDFTTTSPLEIEDIEEYFFETSCERKIFNKLIRNQKKLYQFIKDKL